VSRELEPAYLFFGEAIVWRCESCLRMFFVSTGEAVSGEVPRHIWTEFTSHFCTVPKVCHSPVDQNQDCAVITIIGVRLTKPRELDSSHSSE